MFSRIKTKSGCSAEEGDGKLTGSLEDTPMTRVIVFTSWHTDGLLEWVHTFSIPSRDKKSITAVSLKMEMPFTRSSAMESRAS